MSKKLDRKIIVSYAHDDDPIDNGSVTKLFCERLRQQVHILAGRDIHIHYDRNSIPLGQLWRQYYDSLSDRAAVSIHIISPNYFSSNECRYELQLRLDLEKKLKIQGLILPILYIELPRLLINDVLARAIASRQYVNWTNLRLMNPDSFRVRRAVVDLAQQVIAALERVGS